jgi:hypothetical protein
MKCAISSRTIHLVRPLAPARVSYMYILTVDQSKGARLCRVRCARRLLTIRRRVVGNSSGSARRQDSIAPCRTGPSCNPLHAKRVLPQRRGSRAFCRQQKAELLLLSECCYFTAVRVPAAQAVGPAQRVPPCHCGCDTSRSRGERGTALRPCTRQRRRGTRVRI